MIILSDTSNKIYPSIDTFSHIRFAPGGEIAIIATARGKKPESSDIDTCIFCPESIGNLSEPYLMGDLLKEMKVRGLYIVNNAYPIVSSRESTSDIDLRYTQGFGGVFYDFELAIGRHLVMVETPQHNLDPFSKSEETANYYNNLVWGYIQMLKSLKSEGYSWGGLGKNRNGVYKDGREIDAGASQTHPHSQAIAMNRVPNKLERLIYSSKEYSKNLMQDGNGYLMLRGCPSCLEVRDNTYLDVRKLDADNLHTSFVAPVPKGQNPFVDEVRIMPRNHKSHFEDMTEEEADSFARILHNTMALLGRTYANMGYNFELRQGPWKSSRGDIKYSHYEFSVYPAWTSHDTEKHTGFIPHLLEASVLKILPEDIAREILKNKS